MTEPPTDPTFDSDFEALLQYLKRSRGFDFTGYKRSSLVRRITKRLQAIDVDGFRAYIDYLGQQPDEFVYLFDTILINVTSFFRDHDTWDYLKTTILPAIFAAHEPDETIRIWSAACASGEEAYSLAMLIAEQVGVERFREQVKIYATDVDDDALNQARQAVYSQRDVSEIPTELLEKYFEVTGPRYVFRKDMRRSIIFGRHDLMQDAPISRINLLLCRNALMYFNPDSQSRILSRFHFSLNDTGYLVMGKAEMLYTFNNLFVPVDLKRRVFKKVAQVTLRDHLLNLAVPDGKDAADRLSKPVRLRESAFDAGAEAQCVVDLNGSIVLINARARAMFGLGPKDVNRPLRDLNIYSSFAGLRAHIQEVYAEGRPALIKDVNWALDSGEVRTLEIQITPLQNMTNNAPLGISLVFRDLTPFNRLQEKLEHAHQELETAYEELQSTNEELETTNEELQSTIEELETTNEELQSTNEELETINEELQSTNEEMQTINLELRMRTTELNKVNDFLESILASLRGSVVVVDPDIKVLIWSKQTEDYWGLRSSEVTKKNFLNLDIGLPVEQLRAPIRACLAGTSRIEVVELDAINRRGKPMRCTVTCTPLINHANKAVDGVIMIMEETTG